MTPSPRRFRLAAVALLALSTLAAQAQSTPTSPPIPSAATPAPDPAAAASDGTANASQPVVSALTAEMFYEVLLGELTARGGEPGEGYGLILNAARQSRDPELFQRAVEIALQARAGDAALSAARAWKTSLPNSREARRVELQILIALNRIGETTDLLRAEVAATPKVEHPLLMTLIARSYSRATDKKEAATVVEQALSDELADPGTAAMAWATVGRLRLAAGDPSGALEAAFKGQDADASAEGPALLALDLIDPKQPLAEPMVKRYLASPDAAPEIRLAYARTLAEQRRYDESSEQIEIVTQTRPTLPEPWLLLASLQAQTGKNAQAEKSARRYVDMAASQPSADLRNSGLTQAYFLLSQLAERRGDLAQAQSWMARIDSTDELTAVQMRRASLLAKQGKLSDARALVQELPDATPEQQRQKLQAEVQLLRDAGRYQQAYDMLARASAQSPDDTDLIYDQAMVAEKLDRLDEMESLLRRLIELKPDSPNAYNALGYSLADRKLRLEEARTLIQKAVSLAPDDPFIADSLGWVEYRLGNLDEATRILEDAYKRRPDPEIGAHLGEVLWVAGQRDRARSVWRESTLADAGNETLVKTLKRLRVKL